jgi:hypothetical protein
LGTTVRTIRESDHEKVASVVNEWWGGRDMAWLLPRLFFRHFGDTSFAVEEDGELIAFHTAIGFSLKESDTEIDGVPVYRNYDGPDRDRVVFEKMLCS